MDLAKVPRFAQLWALESSIRQITPARKVHRHFLEAVRSHLQADAAWLLLSRLRPGHAGQLVMDGDPSVLGTLDLEALVRAFVEQRRPSMPPNVVLAPLRADGRLLGAVGAARPAGRDLSFDVGRGLARLAGVLATDLARREDERLTQVLDRIRQKVLSEIRPKDLAYQILDGIHQLLHYDHSASLLLYDPDATVYRVEAEKIAWAKAKSRFVGRELPGQTALRSLVARHRAIVLQEPGAGSRGDDAEAFSLLTYHGAEDGPRARSILCMPLFSGTRVLGLLRVAGHHATFDRHDLGIVDRFLPAAEIALRNVQLKQSLERQATQAEMRASLVTFARLVAHDVNNALGTMLPLVEAMHEEAGTGALDQDTAREDLGHVLEKTRLIKRLFSNIMRAGSGRVESSSVDLSRLVRGLEPTFTPLVSGLPVRVELDLEPDLPPVLCSTVQMERVVFNLVTNSIQALAGRAGRIEIVTRRAPEGQVLLTVADDGPGISPEHLDKVVEPFFTTKAQGNGLGLALCRSIAWQYDGDLRIQSELERGTRVELRLPPLHGGGRRGPGSARAHQDRTETTT